MANINLMLIIKNEEKVFAEGIIDENGKITYTRKRGTIPASHGKFNLNEVYMQLLKLAQTKYKKDYFEIKVNIEEF